MISHLYLHRRARQWLPAGIETTGVEWEGDMQVLRLLRMSLSPRMPSQGRLTLRLSESSAARIEREGLNFFRRPDCRHGEGGGRVGVCEYRSWHFQRTGSGNAYTAVSHDGGCMLLISVLQKRIVLQWCDTAKAGVDGLYNGVERM